MADLTDITLLRLDPIDVPPYSARGISQTLEPIEAAAYLRRDVNGNLIDLSVSQERKFRSTITCEDQDHPALNGVWPGMQLTVDCVVELAYADATDGAADRTAVAGSTRTADGFIFYRPQLVMLVVGYTIERDEYGAAVGWTLDLEEV